MNPPDLEGLSRHFTAHNFLPMAFCNMQPRILKAMQIASDSTSDFYLHKIAKLTKEIKELRKTGLKNQ